MNLYISVLHVFLKGFRFKTFLIDSGIIPSGKRNKKSIYAYCSLSKVEHLNLKSLF